MRAPAKTADPTSGRQDDSIFHWLVAILLATVLEGALRKWVLPTALHPIAYGTKDLIAALFIFRHPIPPYLTRCIGLRRIVWAIGFILATSFVIGALSSLPSAVMIYKNAVLWPAFGITLAAYVTPRSLERFTVVLAIVGICVALLGVAQFMSPPGSRINTYVISSADVPSDVAQFGGHVRATGTFSFLAGYACFGIVLFSWMLWRFASKASPAIVAGPAAAAAIAIMLTSGSRATLVTTAATLCVLPFFLNSASSRARAVGLLATMLALTPLLAMTSAGQAFLERWQGGNDTIAGRMALEGTNFLTIAMDNPVGNGLGSQSELIAAQASEAAGQLVVFSDDPRSRVATESGVAGLIALLLSICVILGVIVLSLRSRDIQVRAAAGAFSVVATFNAASCMWFDHNASAFWWLVVGAWLGSSVIEIRRKRQTPAGPPQQYARPPQRYPSPRPGRIPGNRAPMQVPGQ